MYPAEWHRIYGDRTGASARAILPPLLDLFGISSLVEIGCGNAHWTQAACDHGVADYCVVDGPWNDRAALLVEADRFVEADLGQPLDLGRRFDLAVCLEVAEHVRGASAGVLVASLVRAADMVLFGAAIPMQGGHGHINEQWPSYWQGFFASEGFRAFDLVRPRHWANREIHYWYRQNCVVYVSEKALEKIALAERAAEEFGSLALIDAVHPEKWEEMAGYETIVLKRLLKRLPGWLARRVRQKLTGVG